jgi:hypothetical protein
MNPIDDYFLIKPDDLYWRYSDIVKIPNTDFLKTKSFLVHVYGKVRDVLAHCDELCGEGH